MEQVTRRISLWSMVFFLLLAMVGCGTTESSTALDSKNPTTITIWNYYNGDQLTSFESLVESFNATVGVEKGIVVVSLGQGDITTLADALLDAVNGKAGAGKIPTLAAVYPETGYILEQQGQLVPLDSYFTDSELKQYIPSFLEEGRFNKNNELMLFPISKSTEVYAVNATDWVNFEEATGYTTDGIQTNEDLVEAAKAYYEWTDSLTPTVPEDGKALYGRDSIGNYMYIGSYQLGHPMFQVTDGQLEVNLDRDTFKTLWDNYYIPYINGYFGSYANFRSEDAKTGKILALTSSSSGVSYLPTEVTLEDDSKHPIDIQIKAPLKFANAKNDGAVQQGAGYCLLKSTEAEQEGAVEFLKWFTQPERNTEFALMSSYSPVVVSANTDDVLRAAYTGDTTTGKGKNVLDALLISASVFSSNSSYVSKPFEGSKEVRSVLDRALQDIAVKDRAVVLEAIASGKSREEAVADYSTDTYFDAWFESVRGEVTKQVGL